MKKKEKYILEMFYNVFCINFSVKKKEKYILEMFYNIFCINLENKVV